MPDVPGPQTSASSWPTGGLGDALPQGRNRPRAEVSQQAKDRYAVMERQMKQPELDRLRASRQNPDPIAQPDSGALSTKQGKRPRDASPQWDASKILRILRSSMDVDEQYPDPIDFNAIINPRKKPKCAFRVDDGPIIGSPFVHPDNCVVNLVLDAGRYGQPSSLGY